MISPNLNTFYCDNNLLTSLPDINCSKLKYFNCSNNKLTSLPDINCCNLDLFDCSNNLLTKLPDNIIFPNLRTFKCGNNMLISLPASILNLENLVKFKYYKNEFEITPQLIAFINHIQNKSECRFFSYSNTSENNRIMKKIRKNGITMEITNELLLLNKNKDSLFIIE